MAKAKNLKSRKITTRSEKIPVPVRLRVVYPKPQQLVYEDSTFIMGSVSGVGSPAHLRLNGQNIPLSPRGFFVWKIPLRPGLNPVKLQVVVEGKPPLAENLFAVYSVPPLSVLPAQPLAVQENTMQPASDVWLSEGDTLHVACLASVSSEVSVTIPGLLETPWPLKPVTQGHQGYLDTRERIFAQMHYTAPRIPLTGYVAADIPAVVLFEASRKSGKTVENLPVILHLRQGQAHVQKTLPGRLSLLTSCKPAVTVKSPPSVPVVARVSPVDGDRLTPQRAGTLLQIDALQQGWVRARLSADEYFWVGWDDVRWLPQAGSHLSLDRIQTHPQSAFRSQVQLAFVGLPEQACPILVQDMPESNRLQIRLYGVKAPSGASGVNDAMDDALYDSSEDPLIRQVHWRLVADDVVEVWVDLARPLAGYDYHWQNGAWHLNVKALPDTIAQTRVLIDPGHGGAEWGSTGLDGTPEKNLNLKVSQLLKTALQAEGFQVVMTRQTDGAVSLQQRQDKAVQIDADVLISLHHNALPDGRDPLAAIGACTFYYYPFAKPLAEVLLAGLTDNGGSEWVVPNYGLFTESLFIPRIHQATSVLVEVGFFTNPTEFERLINPAFQAEAARRLARSLKAYWQSRQG